MIKTLFDHEARNMQKAKDYPKLMDKKITINHAMSARPFGYMYP